MINEMEEKFEITNNDTNLIMSRTEILLFRCLFWTEHFQEVRHDGKKELKWIGNG